MGKLIAGTAFAVAAFAMAVTPAGAQPSRPAIPVAPASPGQATEGGDGLRAQAAATYAVDPGTRTIRASVEMTLTHEYDPDYYFHAYDVPVLAESINHRVVRSDGSTLGVDVEPDDNPEAGVSHAVVDLQPNLFAGDTISFRLDYDLPFQAPRSPGWSRGNDAVVTFPAFTPGDPGLARMEVRIPAGYEVEMGGDELERSEADGQVVLSAEAIPEPWDFTTVVVATRDDEMLSREAEVADLTLTLRAWPDDAAWIDYVSGQLGAQMPVLEELVGQSWPDDRGELEVIESSVPGAHGYAGWFDHAENSITLGDEFDSATIAHELAHVWFNGELFTGRWINEGLADEYAESTLEQLATPGFLPSTMPAPDPAGPGAVALNDWADTWSFDDVDHAREQYAYLTSWYVVDQIADEVGVEGLRSMVTAAVDRRVSYPGDPAGESNTGRTTWRVLLDLLENEAGSTRADGLFARFVANPAERAEMDARRVARTAYAAFAERSGGWTPPFELRRAMSTWAFDKVDGLIAAAEEVLAVRAEIDEVLSGVPGPGVELRGLEERYESATDIDDAAEEADATLDAAHAYRDAALRHDEVTGNLIARVGLVGTDYDGRLGDARADLVDGRAGGSLAASRALEQRLDTAVRNGLLRLAAGLLLVGLVAAAVVWGPVLRRRRRRRRDREVRQLENMFAAPEAPEASVPEAPGFPAHPGAGAPDREVPPTDSAPAP